eukprot:524385-Pyramimonas_sp.AAC.1
MYCSFPYHRSVWTHRVQDPGVNDRLDQPSDPAAIFSGKGKAKISKQDVLAILNQDEKSNDDKAVAIVALLAEAKDSTSKALAKELQASQRTAELAGDKRDKRRAVALSQPLCCTAKALAELHRVNTVKEKLEALCRELQKQNKLIHDESKRVAQEVRGVTRRYTCVTRAREERSHARRSQGHALASRPMMEPSAEPDRELDTDTVELTIKTLISHLNTLEFNFPTNYFRASHARVELKGQRINRITLRRV